MASGGKEGAMGLHEPYDVHDCKFIHGGQPLGSFSVFLSFD